MLKQIKNHKELGLILIFALFLRIPLINSSFWMDEAAQALEIVRPLSQQFNIIADFQPPLLHLILHFAQYFSHSEWWLRVIGALIPGLITILFTYKLANKLFNKNVAVLSSLFLATSSFHIFYSQELRPYSLPTMFALISMYYFFQLVQNKSKSKFRISLINLMGLYSSYLFPFLMIAQFIFVFIKDANSNRSKLRSWGLLKKSTLTFKYLSSQIIPIVGFLPWLPMFFKQLEAGGLVRRNLPGWEKVVSIPQIKAIPLVLLKFIFGNLDVEPNKFFIIFGLLVLIPLCILLIMQLKKASSFKKNSSLLFTLSWFLIPLLTSWIISFIVPVVRPKRLLFILPAFYISASFVINNYLNKTKINSLLATTLLLTIFSLNLFSTFSYYRNPNLQRENWKSLYQHITENFSPSNTVIIYSFPDKFAPMAWYDTQNYPSITTGKLSINNIDDLANTLKMVVEYDNVLVFDYLRDLTDPEKKIEDELSNFGLKEVGAFSYPNIGFVRIFLRPHSLIGIK